MELKMSELNQVYNSFSKLTNQRFPVKTSYKLAKLISSLEQSAPYSKINFNS